MKHKLIKTENYLLVVDESEIKAYNYITDNYKVWKWNDDSSLLGRKKVICHLPLNNSPILEGVPLLPRLEDEVEKLANKWAIDNADITMESNSALNKGFKGGYNKAKQKYKYTEEDLRDACIMYCQWLTGGIPSLRIAQNPDERFEQIIQSLQQPKYPVGFECKMERNLVMNLGIDVFNLNSHAYSDMPKTTISSQGQTQLVGTYIYE
jgi:hypothetical protein